MLHNFIQHHFSFSLNASNSARLPARRVHSQLLLYSIVYKLHATKMCIVKRMHCLALHIYAVHLIELNWNWMNNNRFEIRLIYSCNLFVWFVSLCYVKYYIITWIMLLHVYPSDWYYSLFMYLFNYVQSIINDMILECLNINYCVNGY